MTEKGQDWAPRLGPESAQNSSQTTVGLMAKQHLVFLKHFQEVHVHPEEDTTIGLILVSGRFQILPVVTVI